MKNAVKSYRRAVRRHMCCSPAQKRQLTKSLDQMLQPLLEDNPAPNLDTLHYAFGTPEIAAAALISEIPADVQRKAQHIRHLTFIACIVAICIMIVSLVFLAWIRPVELSVEESFSIADDLGTIS